MYNINITVFTNVSTFPFVEQVLNYWFIPTIGHFIADCVISFCFVCIRWYFLVFHRVVVSFRNRNVFYLLAEVLSIFKFFAVHPVLVTHCHGWESDLKFITIIILFWIILLKGSFNNDGQNMKNYYYKPGFDVLQWQRYQRDIYWNHR